MYTFKIYINTSYEETNNSSYKKRPDSFSIGEFNENDLENSDLPEIFKKAISKMREKFHKLKTGETLVFTENIKKTIEIEK